MAAAPPHLPSPESVVFIQQLTVELSPCGQEPYFLFSVGLDDLFSTTICNTPQQDCIPVLTTFSDTYSENL